MSTSGQAKIHAKQRLQFLPPDCLFVIEQFALANQAPADPLLNHVLRFIEIMTGLFTIGPEVLEGFPVSVAPVMELAAGVKMISSTPPGPGRL
jgi:hypothetical protein